MSAAILRVDGDTGALTGRYRDGKFVLSHFSGQRPALMEVTLQPDGSLALLQNRRTKMTAVREEEANERRVAAPTDPSRHSFARSRTERFAFSFPDADGRVVSSEDERFRNKVVIVSITGTWCPNCHDEAPFLSELYEKYRGLGLEIVALSFEEAAQLQDPARLKAYAARYGIGYPMLLAGLPDQLTEKVPQIENLNSFPTTIFLGRDGLVREVHAGFPSKASGRFYTETRDSIRHLVEELLTSERGTQYRALARLDRYVPLRILGPDVLGPRPDQAVVRVLLQHVRRPARDPADGENRREQVDGDAERVIGRRRIEVDVRIQFLLGLDDRLDPLRHLEPLGLPARWPSSRDIWRRCVARGSSV